MPETKGVFSAFEDLVIGKYYLICPNHIYASLKRGVYRLRGINRESFSVDDVAPYIIAYYNFTLADDRIMADVINQMAVKIHDLEDVSAKNVELINIINQMAVKIHDLEDSNTKNIRITTILGNKVGELSEWNRWLRETNYTENQNLRQQLRLNVAALEQAKTDNISLREYVITIQNIAKLVGLIRNDDDTSVDIISEQE